MNITPEERFAEIKKEIIKISESFVLVKQNMNDEKPTLYEQRHIQLLQSRLNDLVTELNDMSAKLQIVIPLLYKDTVNKLRRSLLDNCSKEFVKLVNEVEDLNVYLY